MNRELIIFGIIALSVTGVIIILRYFWAWLFRINEVINHSKETNRILQEISNKLNK